MHQKTKNMLSKSLESTRVINRLISVVQNLVKFMKNPKAISRATFLSMKAVVASRVSRALSTKIVHCNYTRGSQTQITVIASAVMKINPATAALFVFEVTGLVLDLFDTGGFRQKREQEVKYRYFIKMRTV